MHYTSIEEFTVHCPPEDEGWVHDTFDRFPILRRACCLAEWEAERANSLALRRAVELIEAINPAYPNDSFDVTTLARLLTWRATLSTEEFAILRALLPERGSYRFRVRAVDRMVLTVERSPKGGCYSEIRFIGHGSSLALPLTVKIRRWEDMDDPESHGEDCPTLLDDDDPEASDDCNCEPVVEHEAETEVTEWNEEARDFLANFLHDNCVT